MARPHDDAQLMRANRPAKPDSEPAAQRAHIALSGGEYCRPAFENNQSVLAFGRRKHCDAAATRLPNIETNHLFFRRTLIMRQMILAVVVTLTVSTGCLASTSTIYKEPLDAKTLNTLRSDFSHLMQLANRHDFKALHEMFWQSPSALLVAKSAIPTEGNWAGFWGNEAIDQKLRDIGTSGPVVLRPDYSKFKVVGLTKDIAQSYAPVDITVSYAGQDGTPKPFLLLINWIKIGKDWKVASEIILPVPPAPEAKSEVPG